MGLEGVKEGQKFFGCPFSPFLVYFLLSCLGRLVHLWMFKGSLPHLPFLN